MDTANHGLTDKHKRSHVFSTNDPLLTPLEVVLFIKDAALRKHTVKHLFNETEWSSWKLLSPAGRNGLNAMRDGKRRLRTELKCRYFTEMGGRGTAPCGDTCDELGGRCEQYVRNWDERYMTLTKSAIDGALKKPLWVCWKGKDKYDRQRVFMDLLFPSSFGIHICCIMFTSGENANADRDVFVVLTAHKTESTLSEILGSILDRACNIVAYQLPKKSDSGDWKETLFLRNWDHDQT